MATSGSVNFNSDRNELIKGSMRLCGVLGSGETADASDIQDAGKALNLIIKSWQADGMQVWLQDEIQIYLSVGTEYYDINSTGDYSSTDGLKTEIRVAGSTSDTIIEVDSTTGMTAADTILIELDNGTLHADTIASVTDSDTVVITTGLASDSAVDRHVYSYSSIANTPLKITKIWRRDENDIDTPIIRLTRDEYVDLSDKDSQGKINNFFYDRQLTNGRLHVWPTADTVKDRLFAYVHREVEDFDVAADEPDFPKYYHRALKYALAADIAPEYGLPNSRVSAFEQKAMFLKEEASQYDIEEGSVYMGFE